MINFLPLIHYGRTSWQNRKDDTHCGKNLCVSSVLSLCPDLLLYNIKASLLRKKEGGVIQGVIARA
jgi:hypothetical protein